MPRVSKQDRREYDREQWKRRYHTWEGRVNQLVQTARKRARAKKLPCELTKDHLLHLLEVQGYRCAMTGMALCILAVKQFKNPWSPSIDRIEHDKGYTAANVRLVATIVNEARGEHSDEELLLMCRMLLNPLQEEPA